MNPCTYYYQFSRISSVRFQIISPQTLGNNSSNDLTEQDFGDEWRTLLFFGRIIGEK